MGLDRPDPDLCENMLSYVESEMRKIAKLKKQLVKEGKFAEMAV
jgi:hypothetical protein